MSEVRKPMTIPRLSKMKQKGERIAMITAYDYPTAKAADLSGADVILVGDTLGMVVLGYESTVPVTLADMVHHTRAAQRGRSRALLVADLPFLTYHLGVKEAMTAAGELIQKGGAKAVKMEGGQELAPTVKACVNAGIPVMGHIGLKPQSVYHSGYKVQGKTPESAQALLRDAKALEDAGAFAIVLECVTEEVASQVSQSLAIPTIGIGSGRYCDGQVLVLHDIMQFVPDDFRPSFVKTYANVGREMNTGISQYVSDVKADRFPEEGHVFHANEVKSVQNRRNA